MEIFDQLKYFSKSENWGDSDKMDTEFLIRLDFYREKLGIPIAVLCGYELDGHSQNSQHKLGLAADIRPKSGNLLDWYFIADRVGFTGIGLYPNNGRPFIHVDLRGLTSGYRNRWIKANDKQYFSLNSKSFLDYILPEIDI